MSKSVSIVICTYNGSKYLSQQLDSIFAQTYPLHEVIVQDDGSTDDTWNIIEKYANKFPQMRIYRNKEKQGINANFLSAMQHATGDYIAIADQDDIWEHNKIEIQIKAIGDSLLCSGHSRPFSNDNSFTYFDNRHRNVSIFRMLFLCLPGHTLLFKRKLLSMLPPINNSFYNVSLYDAALSITAAAHESIIYVDKVIVNFRRHAKAATYTDYHKSLPSWRNAITELIWSLKHYHKMRKIVLPIFKGKLSLIEYLEKDIQTVQLRDAKKIMYLECKHNFLSLVRLQILFIKHHRDLFHTKGSSMIKILRAILYPFMQLYMYRNIFYNKDKSL